MNTVVGKRCYSVDEVLNGVEGSFFVTPERDKIYLQLPAAGFCALNVAATSENPRTWALSGTDEKPTLAPSIDSRGAQRWHGYLRDGVFEEVG